jgi:hypothetical protein
MADAAPRHLAVLISGQVRHANVSFFSPNPVLGLSPQRAVRGRLERARRLAPGGPRAAAAALLPDGDQGAVGGLQPGVEELGYLQGAARCREPDVGVPAALDWASES